MSDINFSVKDKIGYISRKTNSDGETVFKFIESKIRNITIGKTKISVKADGFYTLDADEIQSNTNIIQNGRERGLMLVNEPFITDDEYSEICRKTVDYWNEHGAKSVFEN